MSGLELLLVVGVDEGLLEIIAPASVGGEGSGDDAAVELGGKVVVLGVLVLLGELGAVVVGGGGGVADVGRAGGAGDGDVEDGLGLVDVRSIIRVLCLDPLLATRTQYE